MAEITVKAEPDTLLACVDEIAAQVHEGRFSEGRAQINYNTFADEYSDGQQYCRRIARKLLEKFQIRHRTAPPRCDAQSVRDATVEECAKVCDLHAKWASGHHRDNEAPESPHNQLFATIGNTATACAGLIRAISATKPARGDAQEALAIVKILANTNPDDWLSKPEIHANLARFRVRD